MTRRRYTLEEVEALLRLGVNVRETNIGRPDQKRVVRFRVFVDGASLGIIHWGTVRPRFVSGPLRGLQVDSSWTGCSHEGPTLAASLLATIEAGKPAC